MTKFIFAVLMRQYGSFMGWRILLMVFKYFVKKAETQLKLI